MYITYAICMYIAIDTNTGPNISTFTAGTQKNTHTQMHAKLSHTYTKT